MGFFSVVSHRPSKESQHSPVVSDPPHCPAPQRQLIVTHPTRHCQTTQPSVLGSLIQQDQEPAGRAGQHGFSQVCDLSLHLYEFSTGRALMGLNEI